jgi:hypothetical protein
LKKILRFFMRLFICICLSCVLMSCGSNEAPKTDSSSDVPTQSKPIHDSVSAIKNTVPNPEAPNVKTVPNSTSAPDEPSRNGAVMHFEESLTFDFGTVKAGELVKHNFEFTNTGQKPLIISDAKASCGCTVPAWADFPIAPNGGSSIGVTFDTAHKLGVQTSSVVVTTNANPRTYKLVMKGIVEE